MSNEPSEQPSKPRKLRALGSLVHRLIRRLARSQHLLAAGLMLVVLVVFFSPGLFSDKFYSAADVLQQEPPFTFADTPADFVPDNRLSGDAAIMFEPWRELLKRSIAQGELPLWNPHQGNGVPHLANSQSALLYPFTWIATFGGPKWGMLVSAFIKLFIAGFGTYLFLRQLRVPFWVATIAGATWMVSSALTVWLPWPITDALIWLPWLLFLIDRAFIKKSQLTYVGVSLVIALIIFSGHIQTAIHIFLVAGAYGLFRVCAGVLPREKSHWAELKTRLWRSIPLLLSVAAGLLLASVHLLPFIEYLQQSFVWVQRQEFEINPYVQPVRLLGLLFWSDLGGNPAWSWAPDFIESQAANFNDSTAGYVGLLPVMVAFAGLAYAWKNKTVWFFVGLTVFALAMAVKVPAFIFALVSRLPGLDTVNHIRILSLFGFAILVVAALGLSAALQLPKAHARRYVGALVGIGVLLVAGLSTIFTHVLHLSVTPADLTLYLDYLRTLAPWYLAELIAAAALTLLILRPNPRRAFHKKWQGLLVATVLIVLAAAVSLAPNLYHGMTYQPLIEPRFFQENSAFVEFMRSHPTLERTIPTSRTAHIWPNLATRFGWYDSRNYDSVYLYESLMALANNATWTGFTQAVERASPSYLSAVGTRYILAADQAELQTQLGISKAEAAEFYPVVADFGMFKVFNNKRVWPRAFVASSPEFFAYPDRVDLSTLVTIETYKNNSVSLLLTMPADGYLVLSDSYYKGWNAYVDEVPTPVEQADLNLRSVFVRQGPHRVVFAYEPRSLYVGSVLSVTALVLLLTIPAVVTIWRRRL